MKNFREYTEEEIFILEQSWGKVSIETIAKKLNRSVTGIRYKAFRLGLGGMLDSKDYLIMKDVVDILGTDRKVVSRHINERGLKARRKSLTKKRQVICIEYVNFIEWLMENPKHWNATKSDNLALEMLGMDRNFLERKIKEDTEKMNRTILSDKDIEAIKKLHKEYCSYENIADKLGKDFNTIKWKIHTLIENGELKKNSKEGRMVRRIKRENYGWSVQEDETLVNLFREGKTLREISEVLGKSLGATKSRNQTLSKIFMQGKSISV